jgi:acid phosphatase (class A)
MRSTVESSSMKQICAALACLLFVGFDQVAARETTFIAADRIRVERYLASPPAEGSPAHQAELAELRRIEATRAPADIAAAKSDGDDKSVFLFRSVFGEKFAKENLPTLDALASRLAEDEDAAIDRAKEEFARRRPYKVDTSLHPVCRTGAKDDSYPSGHAALGYVLALTLIDIAPERRDELLERADKYARNRLVCGVHHPSDVAAGRLAAYAIHGAVALDPRYLAEVAAARSELRRTLGQARAD